MKAFRITGQPLQPKRFVREKKMYKLLSRIPALMEKNSQYRFLCINTGPEKGPDFIGLNKRGHLILGEIKAGSLRRDGWKQVKAYGKKFGTMRQNELEQVILRGGIFRSVRSAYKGFLSKKARSAFLNPSRRRIHLVLVGERFSDKMLAEIGRGKMGRTLRRIVKDIKCLEVRLFKVDAGKTIAIAEMISGNRRKLGR